MFFVVFFFAAMICMTLGNLFKLQVKLTSICPIKPIPLASLTIVNRTKQSKFLKDAEKENDVRRKRQPVY